ncbi:ABC transporter ATP-binding protein, partial [Candidatus Bathyarchaeota archaeon]|nr:ABC transporter ATP-binding protein [Candidatus Bathyarchaeota archaeon]
MSLLLSLTNVTKKYGEKTALENINLNVHEGEFLAVIGPNGAGKTTLLKIMAGIEAPTKGEIGYKGKNVTGNLEVLRRGCTMVFQRTVTFNTTVFKNVAYGLRIRGYSEKEIKNMVKKALELVELKGYENHHARRLSGGEQQRVALARALVLNPELLLLDEPTANLDPKNALIIEDAMARVNREANTTIVMATHNLFQAKRLPNRMALISNGQINDFGEPEEVFGKLSKSLVAFAALENTFSGKAEASENGTTVIDVGNNVKITSTEKARGKVLVFIRPEDIILSKHPISSSARNIFK